MRCPVDDETLVMADRNGVEIDYCPKCRGVWLDRGELDKIIERAAADSGSACPARSRPDLSARAGYRAEPTRQAPRVRNRAAGMTTTMIATTAKSAAGKAFWAICSISKP